MKSQIIIKKPVITEKSLKDAALGIYTFSVEKTSNKRQIAGEIESHFKVHVTSITTAILKGKKKSTGKKRNVTVRPDTKKARVRLKKGERIEIFEVQGK